MFAKSLLRPLFISGIVVISGLLIAVSPFGRWLEEDISLSRLFKLRGEIPAPNDVVVISIDQSSSKKLGLPNKPRKWPRYLHGDLVDRLSQHGASAIAFDIIFEEEREPLDNRHFAEAMLRHNNAILFQDIKQEILPIGQDGDGQGNARIEQLVKPVPVLADGAIGLSPFLLPVAPAKVNHFWLYKPELGDTPMMPVTMLQLYSLDVYDIFIHLLKQYAPQHADTLPADTYAVIHKRHIQKTVRDIRAIFERQPQLQQQITKAIEAGHYTSSQQRKLHALLYSYCAPYSMYLNYYGGSHSIKTIPYHQVLSSDPAAPTIDVKGKAVFVGFSEQFQPEQKDGFYTVYTDENSGLDISGVEIMATAFANLLQQNAIRVPSSTVDQIATSTSHIATAGLRDIFFLVLWGIGISLLWRFTPGALQFPVAGLLALLYAGTTYSTFTQQHLWLPLAIPVLWQLPLATGMSFWLRYRDVQRERRNIREAFGYHLPIAVVDQIAKGMNHVTTPGEHVHGIVMATDAAQYTQLSEQLPPERLHALMNDYYETIFKPISTHNGIVSDVVGDAAMAIWAKPANTPEQHQLACVAALQIQAALEQFNRDHPAHTLHTRIGLHSGEIVLGHVGALDHYEYRAIGDIVNTASRIEVLNKRLGTAILVSESIRDNLTGLLCRPVGQFILAGKQTPLMLFELIGVADDVDARTTTKINAFTDAVALFARNEFNEAEHAFARIADQYSDGPSRFYQQRCRENLENNAHDIYGIITLQDK